MSETEHEETEPVETPELEPDEEEQAAEEDETGEPEADPEAAPEQEPQPEDKEIDAIYAKLGTKAKNYTKGLGELLGESNVPVAPCEMCADAFPGVRWTIPSDEMHATLLAVVGAGDSTSPLTTDPDAEQCDRCNGWGATTLPTHVPGNEQRICRKCNGAGYLDPNPQSGAMQPPPPTTDNGETELLPGVSENDPSVVDLRARGYTIIPPMQIAAQAE